MNNVLVSIITPNYNCVDYIDETIKSVINQTYLNWELLIQDDFSTDGSYEKAVEWAKKDSRIKVERNEKNSGAAITRNNAISRSTGTYLAFLDSDDIWSSNKLERQLVFMQSNNCDFSYSRYELIDKTGSCVGKRVRIPSKLTYGKYLLHCFTGCLTVMYNAEKLGKNPGPNVKNNNDYALFLPLVKKAEHAYGIQEVLGQYRISPKSVSRNKFKKVKPYIEVLHKYNKIPIMGVVFFLFTNVLIKIVYKYQKYNTDMED